MCWNIQRISRRDWDCSKYSRANIKPQFQLILPILTCPINAASISNLLSICLNRWISANNQNSWFLVTKFGFHNDGSLYYYTYKHYTIAQYPSFISRDKPCLDRHIESIIHGKRSNEMMQLSNDWLRRAYHLVVLMVVSVLIHRYIVCVWLKWTNAGLYAAYLAIN